MSTSEDKSVEAQVLATMQAHSKAMTTGDVDVLLNFYSEDWQDNHRAGKDSLKVRFERMSDKHDYKDMEIYLSKAKVVVDGDSATVTPVTHLTSGGSITYTHPEKRSRQCLASRLHPGN
jgi:ketosteroid isomerase-like protein|tara:strand:- start:13892 stop:14248 length:357 start_codon:yes stop_codon:yes gene_type:complete